VTGAAQYARWWIEDYAVAARLQIGGMLSRVDPASYAAGSERPCLVIPGVYETWHFMVDIVEALHRRGHPVIVVPALRHNRRPVEESAELVTRVVEERDLRDVFIAAHSKGGLIGKYAMLNLDAEGRYARMVAIATPFSGSRYARYMPTRTLRAFRAHDPTTRLLNAEDRVNGRITSVFGEFDPIIPESSVLPGARNVRLPAGGHFTVLRHPTTLAEVVSAAAS
jgi:pimeloyl-ACP methyl ester carboxylesterase